MKMKKIKLQLRKIILRKKRTFKICALERPDGKTIPIIAMTANAFAEDMQKCLDAGMNAYLAKPLEVQKVIAVIAQGCNNS